MADPKSIVKLLGGVDLTKNYKDTFSHNTESEQNFFFQGKAKHTVADNTYIRRGRPIRVPLNVDLIRDINYLMYRNSNLSDKWFYAFITETKYISDKVTEITFQIDVMETWYFEWKNNLRTCLVEREHVSNDTIGNHTVDENVNVGEMFTVDTEDSVVIKDLVYIFVATEFIDFPTTTPSGGIYSGVYSGLWFFGTDSTAKLDEWILYYNTEGKINTLINIFTMPKALVDFTSAGVVQENIGGKAKTLTVDKYYGSLEGYSPKNNKLYVFPYNYLEVDNNQGQKSLFRYEYFSTTFCDFVLTGNVAPSPVVTMSPASYKGLVGGFNSDEIITLSDYPLVPWVGDSYATWLAQNQVSNTLKIAGSLGAVVGGAVTGNIAAIGGGLAGLVTTIGGFAQESIKPDTAKGSTSGGSNVARGKQMFTFLRKTVRDEQARIIDDFFTMYGYKVISLKIPNITGRPYWNYVKCNEVSIFGDIPNDDLEVIRSNFLKGITFWHSDVVGRYDLNNSI